MSSGAVRLADARAIAAAAVEAFRGLGAGVDAEPVGSVRRCRPIVGDVEVLVTGSTPMQIRFALHAIGAERGPPNKRGARAPWGPRYYRAVLPNGDHTIGLDVFVCLPAECLSCGKFINTSTDGDPETRNMRELRPDVPGARAEVLLPGVRLGVQRTLSRMGLVEGMRGLRYAVHEIPVHNGALLFEEMPGEVAGERMARLVPSWSTDGEVDDFSGRPCGPFDIQERAWVRSRLPPPAPAVRVQGINHASPTGDGTETWEIPGTMGGCPPSQRGEGRQPNPQPRGNNSRAAQRNGPVPRVSANLSGQVICPYCGSRRIRPGAEYGVLRLIRTGSRDFSQAVVTRLHRYGLESRDGRVVDRNDGGPFPTPTEEGVLRLAHLPWIPPSEREMDNPATLAAFRREAAPWECPDQSPAPVRVGVLPARTGDGTPACACRICGMVHPPGACP